jgi:hypothetical protein
MLQIYVDPYHRNNLFLYETTVVDPDIGPAGSIYFLFGMVISGSETRLDLS